MTRDKVGHRPQIKRHWQQPLRWLWVLIAVQATIYAVLTILSGLFDYDALRGQRPIIAVLGLLAACFALHLLSLKLALRFADQVRMAKIIVLAAITFRCILFVSLPIQEIDIYRYLWDGAALAEGVNPFRYSPQQVLAASAEDPLPSDLRRLRALRVESESLFESLQRIHFGDLTTVYPPVAQAVYALAASLTPRSATLYQRVLVMKAILLLFDLATLLLLIWLLRATGRHVAWSILYGWSPLVLKEFANSGHLDAIAVLLTMVAICSCLRCALPGPGHRLVRWGVLAGVSLGLATGAKLYPIVLLPLLAVVLGTRCTWRVASGFAAIGVVVAFAALAPMLLTTPAEDKWTEVATAEVPPLPMESPLENAKSTSERPEGGLATFLQRWEMNDLLFMLVIENLQPEPDQELVEPSAPRLWFVVIPASWRSGLMDPLAAWLDESPHRAAFLVARGISLLAFTIVAAGLIWGSTRSDSPQRWLEMAFLTLAWFWALSPTLNPWYWIWAMPLLPFARGRAWYAVSGLLLLYYLLFWVRYHFADVPLLGTPYEGESFFYFVIVPVEHTLWLAWLLVEWLVSRRVEGSRL